jgi:hypothetical protein
MRSARIFSVPVSCFWRFPPCAVWRRALGGQDRHRLRRFLDQPRLLRFHHDLQAVRQINANTSFHDLDRYGVRTLGMRVNSLQSAIAKRYPGRRSLARARERH